MRTEQELISKKAEILVKQPKNDFEAGVLEGWIDALDWMLTYAVKDEYENLLD